MFQWLRTPLPTQGPRFHRGSGTRSYQAAIKTDVAKELLLSLVERREKERKEGEEGEGEGIPWSPLKGAQDHLTF